MSVIIDDDFLSNNLKLLADRYLIHSDIPYVVKHASVHGGGNEPNLVHTVLQRPEVIAEGDDKWKWQSDAETTRVCEAIFNAFVEKHVTGKVTPLRMCLNLTLPLPVEGAIHVDHNFYHHNFIYIINNAFEGGGTKVIDGDEEILIESKQHRGFMFSNLEHSVVYPTYGLRQILVVTFTVDKEY